MLAVVIFADDEWLCPLLSLQQPCSAMLQHSAVSGRRQRESLRVDSNYVQSLDQPSPTLAAWWCEALLDVNMLDNILHLLLNPNSRSSHARTTCDCAHSALRYRIRW